MTPPCPFAQPGFATPGPVLAATTLPPQAHSRLVAPFPAARLFFFLALLVASLVSGPRGLAQTPGSGTVTGRILNPATGEYVANADVKLGGSDKSTTSDS